MDSIACRFERTGIAIAIPEGVGVGCRERNLRASRSDRAGLLELRTRGAFDAGAPAIDRLVADTLFDELESVSTMFRRPSGEPLPEGFRTLA
jgi:hypothetical protein